MKRGLKLPWQYYFFRAAALAWHLIKPLIPNQDMNHEIMECETVHLTELIDPKSIEKLHAMGGQHGLLRLVGSSLDGLETTQVEAQRSKYGSNVLPEPALLTFYEFVIDSFKDKTLIVLMMAATVKLSIGIYKLAIKQGVNSLIDALAILATGKTF